MQVELPPRRTGDARSAPLQRHDLVRLSTRSWWRVVRVEGETLYLERVSEDLFGELGEERSAQTSEVRARTSHWRRRLS